MISLSQLSKKIGIFIFLLGLATKAISEPKDIWQQSKEIKNKEKEIENQINVNKEKENDLPQTIFDKERPDFSINKISQTENIKDDEIIFGLFEPDETKISLDFWSSIKDDHYDRATKVFKNSKQQSLIHLLEKILFTKSNLKNFSDEGSDHLIFLADWLIDNKKIELIDQLMLQNKILSKNPKLLKFLFTHYLSLGKVDKACTYTNLIALDVKSIELDKYKIYCLVHNKKNKQAQSQLDLVRETTSLNKFFIDKINFLLGLSDDKGDANFNNIFNAHLTILTDKDITLEYENFANSRELRNYFFKSGLANRLLNNVMTNTSTEDKNALNKLIIFLERSVNEDLYDYQNILDIYKKYNFSFDNLLNVEQSSKNLKRPESHAIIYQAMLLAQDTKKKIQLLNIFRDKLTTNGLEKIANPVYHSELEKIYDSNSKSLDKELLNKILVYKQIKQRQNSIYNNDIFFASEIKKLFDKNLDKKEKKRIQKIIVSFDKKIKNNEYKLSNKDIAFINILIREKIDLPNSISKYTYEKEVYIPNEIFNSLEKKLNNKALLDTLVFIGSLNELEQDYTRDILSIMKIFDKIELNNLKILFIQKEFSI